MKLNTINFNNIITLLIDNIFIFRDDLYPFLGGGNKGRKIRYIEQDIISKGANAIVTTGGIQSNHCRATALLASEHNWSCTLVLHGSEERFNNENGNALIIRKSGAKYIFVKPDSLSKTMDSIMNEYKTKGYNPYYIWGGGHTMEGGLAYIEAIEELYKFSEENNWYPDFIFLATGTGSTQAGILAGLDKYQFNKTEVIGISVARKKKQAEKVVSEFYRKLCEKYSIKSTNRACIVLDKYLCGGYEQYNKELYQMSQSSIQKYGLIFDTTYSGKAFYGMTDFIQNNNITGNVLFWHTGGILNFLAK